ncbi:hypothetical protein COM83_12795 [Bacillus cereus]|nr:hypothetical protein COM83_12795 [Bacillus cereus]PFJ47145.1 hypothetical protein COI99_25895 [Bacillus cereus]PFW18604.1 hypothetical protein COL18_05145 [Bacillus cereus]PGW90384.1 hypothetical protein COE40_30975 [Bacillus cereus]PGY22383.1 hypothetical protein COE16_06535 [Bacillus cereus]
MGYGGSCGRGCGFGGGFTLLVVLFILLIIVGASCSRFGCIKRDTLESVSFYAFILNYNTTYIILGIIVLGFATYPSGK